MEKIKPAYTGDELEIGDLVPSAGIYTNPGVIVENDPDGTVRIDTSQEAIDQYHRYGDTTGLTPEEKTFFNEIMAEVMSTEDAMQRIEILQAKVDELRNDETNRDLLKKLTVRQRVLIRKAEELPRFYDFQGGVIAKR